MSFLKRIPFVQQLSATECGAASLCMILGYFGREIGLDRVRDLCGVTRDGVTALSILEAGKQLGLKGRGVKLSALDQLEQLGPGTAILHWQFAHFVVFAGSSANWIEIMDPAVGRRRVGIEEFEKSFTGIALLFEPDSCFVKQKTRPILYEAVKRLVLKSGLLPQIVMMSLLLQVLGLALPVLVGQLVDRIIPRGDINLLYVMLIGLSAMVVFEALGKLVREHLLLRLRTILDAKMSLTFLDHLIKLPYSYFQLRTSGDLLMRLNGNSVVRENLTSGTLSSILDGLYVVVYLAFLLVGSPAMTVAVLVAGALNVGVYVVTRRRQRELAAMGIDTDMKAKSYEVEMLHAMETLKSSGNEHRAVEHWSNLFVDAANVTLQRQRVDLHVDAVLDALRNAGPLLILGTGALEVMGGRISLGTMLALTTLSAGFLGPLSALVETAMSLEVVRSYLARVNDVLEAAPEQDSSKVRSAPVLCGAVELDNVSFRYGLRSPTIVRDVSVRIRPGQFVALVGRSGSGKSTLANLILGLHRPTEGRISFDGIDLGDLDLGSVRRQLGIVNQQLSLFGTTIRENIALSDRSLTLAELTTAARLSCIHDEIMSMPLGYDSPVGEGGTALSGGQRQRLALARALVRKPAVLLLDEATSALDAITESRVQAALDQLHCTRIVIAHRLSTVKNADLILVVDEGAVVEAGTHAELLARGGSYTELVQSQLEQRAPTIVQPAEEVDPPRKSGLQERALRPMLDSRRLDVATLGAEEIARAVGAGLGGRRPTASRYLDEDEATRLYAPEQLNSLIAT